MKTIILLFALIAIFASCKKDNSVKPDLQNIYHSKTVMDLEGKKPIIGYPH